MLYDFRNCIQQSCKKCTRDAQQYSCSVQNPSCPLATQVLYSVFTLYITDFFLLSFCYVYLRFSVFNFLKLNTGLGFFSASPYYIRAMYNNTVLGPYRVKVYIHFLVILHKLSHIHTWGCTKSARRECAVEYLCTLRKLSKGGVTKFA